MGLFGYFHFPTLATNDSNQSMKRYFVFFLVFFLIMPVVIADQISEEDIFVDDETLEGFDEGSEFSFEEIKPYENESTEDKWFTFGGFLKNRTAYSFQHDDPDISLMVSELNLDLNLTLSSKWKAKIDWSGFYDLAYRLQGRDQFTQETLDTYETDSEMNEMYIDGDLNNWFNIRIGRQFFGWGETYSGQISDIGNPRDLREFGLQDIDDIRLSVGATKLTFYGNSWEYNLIAIHERRGQKLGTIGSEFDPYLAARNDQTIIKHDVLPSNSLANTELMTRLFFSGSLGDINFYWGNVYDDMPFLEATDVNVETQQILFTPEYKKIKAMGLFGNVVMGSWLFKFDLARKTGVAHRRTTDDILGQVANNPNHIRAWDEKNVIEWMGGVEYAGISETTISFEYLGETIEDYQDNLADEETTHAVSLYLSRDALHDRLVTTLWWYREISTQADLFKLETSYDYSDELEFTLGISGFIVPDKDNFYYPYRNNDRIYVGIQYGF